MDGKVIWWCAAEERAIPEYQRGDEVQDSHGSFIRACSPDIQCTIGRRRGLPCGWYELRAIEDDVDGEG